MPIYEYRCPACGAEQERLVRLGDTGAELSCEECGRSPLERVPSTFAARGSCNAPSGFG